MSGEDDFIPRLGKPRALGARSKSYLSRVLRSAILAGGGRLPGPKPASRFTGQRIGRGAGVARTLRSGRDLRAGYRSRRVVVKVSTPRLSGRGLAAARAHLAYVQRDGVTRDGAPGLLYGPDTDQADGRAFLDRARKGKDVRQFRFIVSAEDGAEYEHLKSLTRRLMAQVERDLGTRLDWVAVDHHNTGHPHTHIIVRGRDDQGKDLIIAKDYITRGLRERASELVTLDLGPRTDHDIRMRLIREVEQERLTSLDRGLIAAVDEEGLVSPGHWDSLQQTARAGRLQTLRRLGLAEEVAPSRWRLADGVEETLRRMGERGDIQRTLYRALAEGGVERAPADLAEFDPNAPGQRPLVGRVVRRGLGDEQRDRHYLVVDGVDGRAHYVDLGRGSATERVAEGAVVRVSRRSTDARPVDRSVAAVAEVNEGRYSASLHRALDKEAAQGFIQAHERRLEGLRRAGAGPERQDDGSWNIPEDHVERAAAHEAKRARDTPVVVEVLSPLEVEVQAGRDGATWLDRELVSATPEPLRDAGFGRSVRQALDQRRRWLIAEGLARQEETRVVLRAGFLARLERRELEAAVNTIAQERNRVFVETRSGEKIEGVYRRAVALGSGKMALIEKSREFTLVPWRPVLDGQEGKLVSGVMRRSAISWTLGRTRGGPVIE
ncbi:relaxase/mobilization nuclease and DUF3363 domain-containing protein [Caulobacter sp. 602-2]|uniref:Relaxase/mobilization nuclease and DUF3363 domain-containing protein n=1 Tax=Caulobacter sp. 602-2 TaxID=2710887 RepID=A0A6G4QWJ7_9CAUL|nr:relaxase/mobilization nuclease RlxS [Caulobacter sp. 602-2]NGM49318.1 relaxase/mobilization nuclease and DUF3363 domain-containing protein [Caulobacter sp. 602-2]